MKKIALYCNKDHIKYKDSVIIAENLDIKIINDIDLVNSERIYNVYDYFILWQQQDLNSDFYLSIIEVENINKNNKKYLYVDYINNIIANKKCYKFTYQDALPKAMGLHKFKNIDSNINILDGTAGFTLDAYAVAQLSSNINIFLLETSQVIYYLVNDGLFRLDSSNNIKHQELYRQLKLFNNNLIDYLHDYTNAEYNKFDIIYLDPMFENQGKIKSKPQKNMQLLQDLCFNPNTLEELLLAALQCASNRVVIKRNIKQPKLFEKLINYSVASKQIRYDVYLIANNGLRSIL